MRRSDELFRYLEEELAVARAKEIEAELATSTDLAAALEEDRALIDSLRSPDPSVANIDLVAGVRRRIEEEAPRSVAARARRWLVPLALAAGLALVYVPRADDGFTAKGLSGGDKWAGVKAYVIESDAAPRPLGDTLARDDSVVFTYTNLGDDPYAYLMIFGVDEAGEVHWYYPAYTDAATDPAAVRIRSESGDAPLPDRIAHDLSGGRFVINAVFLREPLTVKAVEAALARGESFEDAHVQRIEVKVP